MANELKWQTTSQVTLQSSGASLVTTAGTVTTGGTLSTSHHLNYPEVDLALMVAFASSHAVGGYVQLYKRPLNIDGTAGDSDTPSVSYLQKLVGVFPITGSSASGSHYVELTGVETSPHGDVEFFIENVTNSNINAAWTLKATPKTYVPGA